MLKNIIYYLYRRVSYIVEVEETARLTRELGHFGRGAEISRPFDIRGEQHVFIGQGTYIGPRVLIIADKGAEVKIGNDVMLGPDVSLIAFDHRIDAPGPVKHTGYTGFAPIIINDGAWVGAGATILRGVTIGCGAVVGAGAVVTKNVAEFEVWAGNPAHYVKTRPSKGETHD